MITREQMIAVHNFYPSIVTMQGDVAYDSNGDIVEYDLAAAVANAAAAEAAKQATHESAIAKLKKIGLTDDEISALKGTL